MSLEVFLSAALAACTIIMAYLGLHVTLHPPNDSPRARFWYKCGFFACGVCSIALIIWQGVRNTNAQRAFDSKVGELQGMIKDTRKQVSDARADLQTESARRQQAETKLGNMVQETGRSTRNGVSEDIKKSPIQVQLNGATPEVAPLQAEDVKIIQSVERSNRPDAPYAAQWTVQANVPIMNLFRRVVSCSSPIKYLEWHPTGGMLYTSQLRKDNGKEVPLCRILDEDKTRVVFDLHGQPGIPLFGPETPLIVHVYSESGPITIKAIEVGPR